MRRIQYALHGGNSVAVFAADNIGPGEFQIIKDRGSLSPLLEEMIVAEEVVVSECRMRDHQRLHCRGVLLHQIADAGVRVDDDLVSQAAISAAIAALVLQEALTI